MTTPTDAPTTPADDGQCPSTWPHDPTVRCERAAGHPAVFLHCSGLWLPDGPSQEWE